MAGEGRQAAHPESGHTGAPKSEELASSGSEQVLAPRVRAGMLVSHRASGGAAGFPAADPSPGRTGTRPSISLNRARWEGGTAAAPECK